MKKKDLEKLNLTGDLCGIGGSGVTGYQEPNLLSAGRGLEDDDHDDIKEFSFFVSFCCLM